MERKRAILLTSDEDVVFRYDRKPNGHDFIEQDIYKSLIDMEKAGLINLRKVFNMLKAKYGLTLSDSVDVIKELVTGEDNWRILTEEEIELNLNKIGKVHGRKDGKL